MKSELIAFIIFLCSLISIGVMIYRKIPLLLKLPKTAPSYFVWQRFFLKAKELNPLKQFSSEMFLQKTLSKVRVLTLKTDNKTSSWLQSLRQKTQKKKFQEDDKYWEEIKKSTRKK